jgi:hypothetical protein
VRLKGFPASPENFKEIIKSDNVSVKLLPYTEDVELITYFKNNSEFFSMLLEEVQVQPPTAYPEVVQETVLRRFMRRFNHPHPVCYQWEKGSF